MTADTMTAGAAPADTTGSRSIFSIGDTLRALRDRDAAGREKEAETIVHRHALYCAAPALIPIPGVDLAGAAGVQLLMISRLCDYYGVSFSKNIARDLLVALSGAVAPMGITGLLGSGVAATGSVFGLGLSATKLFSFVGIPALAYLNFVTTKTIGLVFVDHFEHGGTLTDFDAEEGKAKVGKKAAAVAASNPPSSVESGRTKS